jgi:hypothetical protein
MTEGLMLWNLESDGIIFGKQGHDATPSLENQRFYQGLIA